MKLKIEARRTAVLLLDVQKDLVDITPGLRENRVLEHMASVLRAARRRKSSVIHITASVRPDFLDLPKDNPLWDGLRKKRIVPASSSNAIPYSEAPLNSPHAFGTDVRHNSASENWPPA